MAEMPRFDQAMVEQPSLWKIARYLVAPLASLKLTVLLVALSVILIFCGTLVQVDEGIWTVVHKYFRNFTFAWFPVRIFYHIPGFGSWFPWLNDLPYHFPFFGGWLLGSAMLINLVAAHAIRFKLNWRRSGVLLIHGGLIVMLLGELITGLSAVEGNMTIVEGESSNYIEDIRTTELAVIRSRDGKEDDVVVVPENRLRPIKSFFGFSSVSDTQQIEHADLPFDVEVVRYMVNSQTIPEILRVEQFPSSYSKVDLESLFSPFGSVQSILLVQEVQGAIVSGQHETWLLKLAGPREQVKLHSREFEKFVRSIRFSGNSKPIEWNVPEQWHQHSGSELGFVEFHLGDHEESQVVLTATSRENDSESVLEHVNRWANQLAIPPFDNQSVKPVIREIELDSQTVTLVKLTANVAWVRMRAHREALAAINARDGFQLGDQKLRVGFLVSDENPATSGFGRTSVARETPEVTGTESQVDIASIYVRLLQKNTQKRIGTFLFSQHFNEQPVSVKSSSYQVALRFRRSYKSYSVYLEDFKHDLYIGTDTPRNYSSQVRLLDPDQGVERDVNIYMNHPLRYSGETFFQSSFLPGDRGTILQVVKNPGWLMPYVSCGLVSIGMLIQFGLGIFSFLGRGVQHKENQSAWDLSDPSLWCAAVACALGIVFFGYSMRTPEDTSSMNVQAFGRMPVVYQGRAKPLDTLARNALTIISGRDYFENNEGARSPAIVWLMDVMFDTETAFLHEVFKIPNEEVRDLLELKERKRFRYALEEFRDPDKIIELEREANRARSVDAKQRTVFDQQVVALAEHLQLFWRLAVPHSILQEKDQEELLEDVRRYQMMKRFPMPHLVPPLEEEGEWSPAVDAVIQAAGNRDRSEANELQEAVTSLINLSRTYAQRDHNKFNSSLRSYRNQLQDHIDPVLAKAEWEVRFNAFDPFNRCSYLYVAIFLISCLSWLGWNRPLNRAAFWIMVPTLVVHTGALVGRMYLQERPPVTNLYSSAIFIGWGCVVMSMLLEGIFRNGIGNVVCGVTGFLTLRIADGLAGDGDTMEMMQAVLDTNFWLATHVTCITFGYSATFLAGFLGILFVLLGLFTKTLSQKGMQTLGRMIYGIVCFATLLSFVGTVLGGIWADQSWGRFWGWDPKENGALIIVLWNALILHARWGGMIRQRGVAVLAITGNIVTAWSWFGVNLLGVGLHSYGFLSSTQDWLLLFATSQLALVGLGSLPIRLWRSGSDRAAEAT